MNGWVCLVGGVGLTGWVRSLWVGRVGELGLYVGLVGLTGWVRLLWVGWVDWLAEVAWVGWVGGMGLFGGLVGLAV